MIDFEPIAIVAECAKAEWQIWIANVALFCLSAILCGWAVAKVIASIGLIRRLVRWLGVVGCVLVIPCLIECVLYGGGKAKPNVTFDDYLANDGTYYASNGVTKVGVVFKWTKTDSRLPNTQPLYISKQATNENTWTQIATTTVGGSPYAVTISDPMQFRYYVWHEWSPPSPVHTNVVWLGNILEKSKGDKGLNKILIINGELRQNGKVIAP